MSGSRIALKSPWEEDATAQLLGLTFKSMRTPPIQMRASTQLESGNPNGIRPELKYISSKPHMLSHKYNLVEAQSGPSGHA